jgi:hypothetical protein
MRRKGNANEKGVKREGGHKQEGGQTLTFDKTIYRFGLNGMEFLIMDGNECSQ